MSHIVADRVKETTTTTGTGNITPAGAGTGFRSISSVCATNDTFPYCIRHQSANEWEVGEGLWNGSAVVRNPVDGSSGPATLVNFSAGTKDIFISSIGIHESIGVLQVAPATNQDDYNPTGLVFANTIRVAPTASMKITGLAGGFAGRRIRVHNASADFLLWFEHNQTTSTAANRFILPYGFPLFLMPGDFAEFQYDDVDSRWYYVSGSSPGVMGLQFFTDFVGGTGTANLSPNNGLVNFVSGTGAAAAVSTYLANTTEKPLGIVQFTSGTVATNRAGCGSNNTGEIIPGQGAAISVARLAVQTTVSGTETFQVVSGFIDSLAAGALTDGVYWNNRWTGAAAEWSQDRAAAATVTRTNTGSPTPDNNYIWLVVFINAAWNRADFIYSTDSRTFQVASSPTTGFPSSAQPTAWCPGQIIKSVGTTARLFSIDLAGYRYDLVRG